MASACFDKCIHNYRVKVLDVGEQTCSDRCAFKYWTTHQTINEEMKRLGIDVDDVYNALMDQ